jgi:translation initiation factor 1
MKPSEKNTRLVYSTEMGRIETENTNLSDPPQNDGIIRIRREIKGRKGKTVTVIWGIPADENQINKLAKELKQKCACGGTVQDRHIIIQGDHLQKISQLLTDRGYRVKKAGN